MKLFVCPYEFSMNAWLQQMILWRDQAGGALLFVVGAMLLTGYLVGLAAGKIGLPQITGFILAGVLVGESGLGLVPREMTASMQMVTEVALGLIALTIGSEFSRVKLRRMGREVAAMAGLQLAGVFAMVLPAMLWMGLDLPFALILAAIATASSPAVVVAVVQSLRAHGVFVDYLYGVVALLDAGTVILFGICFSIAASLLGLAGAGAGAAGLLLAALGEVFFSLVAGVGIGLALHLAVHRTARANEILIVTLGVVFIGTALASQWHLSPLLVNMTAGAVLINVTPRHYRVFRTLEPLSPPLYALFFVLAGCELHMGLLIQPPVLLIGGAYVLTRGVAKYLSAYAGAAVAGVSAPVQNNLGWCMLPQAGVSLGLVLMVQAAPLSAAMSESQAETTLLLVNIVLFSVFVNEVVGPPLAKRAVIRGNEMEASG